MNTVQQNTTTNQVVSRETKNLTKQEMLDKMPANNYEVALQNMLFSLSKTKLEQIKRMFNELNNNILYKTQLRELKWIEIYTAINEAVKLNNPIKNETDDNKQ